jgi:hypothetical protein
MHADGLPSREVSSRALRQTGSQRFIERWHGVTGGY